ncbi:MAG: outer membrane protein assembly factor BamD [Planctomycetota bacterium]|nr:outer membrane protein assembly factor BamD [Planctomycetaceae bacterium]MDQ3332140.1 outer membrane protein assembly factor BamD [Planctomycetota bacterium]
MPRRAKLTPRLTLLSTLCFGAAGCASIDQAMLGVDSNDRVAMLGEEPKPPGAMDRFLYAAGLKKKEVSPYMRPTVPAEAQAAYEDAQRLFDSGDHKAAEEAAHKLAKKYRDTVLEEDVLFLEAESQFQRKRYAAAQDTYAELFERFPSTRYMDRCTSHLFEISRYWLQSPEIVKSAEIQPVNFDAPSRSPLPSKKKTSFDVTRTVPFLPNVADRTRPFFDTEGRALEALKSIWLNDPTGELADDALMLSASHYLRKGDYLEADRFYDILREEYPKSPHLEDAFVLGSHVKLMSYQGAAYDEKSLLEAEKLKESTLKLFPDSPERDRLSSELRRIADLEAERRWQMVEFWRGKGRRYSRSVAVQCHALLTEYPNSKYAAEARKIYSELSADDKKHLPPLPTPPRVVPEPSLERIPNEPYGEAEPPAGRVKL